MKTPRTLGLLVVPYVIVFSASCGDQRAHSESQTTLKEDKKELWPTSPQKRKQATGREDPDRWGKPVAGIRCGIRVESPKRIARSRLPSIEYVVENVSNELIAFQKPKCWRFSVRSPAGQIRNFDPADLVGSRDEVYLRIGERARGIIRDSGALFALEATGEYQIMVSWSGGPRVVSSDWATFTLGEGSSQKTGDDTPSMGEGTKIILPRNSIGCSTIRSSGPYSENAENLWGNSSDGIRVGIGTRNAYQISEGLAVNVWIQNVGDQGIEWLSFDLEFVTIEVRNEKKDLLQKTVLGQRIFSENGPKVGNRRLTRLGRKKEVGWAVDLVKHFIFTDRGIYHLAVVVRLVDVADRKQSVTRTASHSVTLSVEKQNEE